MTFLKFIILARLLPPREFGILTIAMLVVEILEIFTQTGFFAALVQKKEKVEEFIHVAWTVAVIRGAILFLVLFYFSSSIVRFFDNSGRFEPMDIKQSRVLASRIANDPNRLNQYLFNSMSESAQQKIKASATLSDYQLEMLLTDELNVLCQKESLYSPERFQNITLSAYAISEIQKTQSPSPRLNRLLLEEAFPNQIKMRVLNIPQMTVILRMIAFLFLIYGMSNSRLFLLTKYLEFDKTFYMQSAQSVLSFCVTVSLAFWLRNVWALVWGQLIGAVIGNILGYIVLPYRPRLEWDLCKIRQLWKFGRHITGIDIIGFFSARGDNFIVGKILGMTAMGHYAYACKLSYLVPEEVGNVISKISFPAYSQIQDCIEKIRNGYHKSIQLLNIVCFPVTGLLLVTTPLLIGELLGDQWLPICPVVRILCLIGLFRGPIQCRSIFLSLNRPDIQTRIAITRCLFLFGMIYPLIQRFGTIGAAMSVIISLVFTIPVVLHYTNKLIHSGYVDFFKLAWIPFIAMLGMIGGIACLRVLFAGQSWLHLIGLTIFGFFLYGGLVWFLDTCFNGSGILCLIREMIGAIRKKTPTIQRKD